jgi:hypothetical protein
LFHLFICHCEEFTAAFFAAVNDEAISSLLSKEKIASVGMTAQNAVTPPSQWPLGVYFSDVPFFR